MAQNANSNKVRVGVSFDQGGTIKRLTDEGSTDDSSDRRRSWKIRYPGHLACETRHSGPLRSRHNSDATDRWPARRKA